MCVIQLLSAMVSKLGNMDDPLPQESFEGVDDEEWVSTCDNFLKIKHKSRFYVMDQHKVAHSDEVKVKM